MRVCGHQLQLQHKQQHELSNSSWGDIVTRHAPCCASASSTPLMGMRWSGSSASAFTPTSIVTCRVCRCICACRQQVDKKTVLENLDLVLLVMDEIVDGGCATCSAHCTHMMQSARSGTVWVKAALQKHTASAAVCLCVGNPSVA